MSHTQKGMVLFRRNLTLGFAALVLVLVLAAIAALVTLRQVTRSGAEATAAFDELGIVLEVRVQAEQLVAVSRGYLILGTLEARQRLDETAERFETSLNGLAGRAAIEHDPGLTDLSATARAYITTIRETARTRIAARDPAAIVAEFEKRVMPKREQLTSAADEVVARQRARTSISAESAESIAHTAQIALAVLLGSALVLSFMLAWHVGRRLVVQYHQVQQATDAARRAVGARDEIIAIVSHDLRAPLTAVTMGAEVLDESGVRPEQQRMVRAISNAAERMRHLADDLVDRQQLEDGTIELAKKRVECKELIAAALDLYQQKAQLKRVELRSDTVDDCAVEVDHERLLQVLSNLLGNALKFTPPGGSITVRAASSGHAMRFEISDTGAGIPRHQLPLVFDKFFQGEKREPGSVGLGLYICKRIVEAHGGTIGVESSAGRGTTFWFEIPKQDRGRA